MEITKYQHGSFCWVDSSSSDIEKVKPFYETILGLTASPCDHGFMLQLHGKDISLVSPLNEQQKQENCPSHWMAYIAVDDINAVTEKAAGLGGKVHVEPCEMPGIGSFALLEDPFGARFALYQAKGHIGTAITGEPGTPCWVELDTTDIPGSIEFYTKLIGWEHATQDFPGGTYNLFKAHNQEIAGVWQMPAEHVGKYPPNWQVYFAVADCDVTAAKVKENGGLVHMEPMTVAGVGRMAVIGAPDGAVFSVIAMQ